MDSKLGSALLALAVFSTLCFVAAYLCQSMMKPLRHKLLAQNTADRVAMERLHSDLRLIRLWALGIGSVCLCVIAGILFMART